MTVINLDVFLENIKENVENDEFDYKEIVFYNRLIKNVKDIFDIYENNLDLNTAERKVFKGNGKHVNDKTIINETLRRLQAKMCTTSEGFKDFNELLKKVQEILNSELSSETKIKDIKRLLAEKSLENDMDCYLFEAIDDIFTDRYYALEAKKRRRQNGK